MSKTKEPASHTKRFLITAVCGVAVLCAGFALGYFIRRPAVISSQSLREPTDQYKFVDPLLAVSRPDIGTPTPAYAALAKQVNNFIVTGTASGSLQSASVYFVNYGQKGGSFAINQNVPYDPASMLKVVIMVAYLKESDSDPTILDKQLEYTPAIEESEESVPFDTPSTLTVDTSYSVSDLIDRMIIDSDNGAMNVLLANMDDGYLNQVYTDLGLQGPQANAEYTISANDYSLFFRVLYNATYLSAASSEKALSILSQATFKDGLVAGVPSGTIVAHKFGEHVNGTGDQIQSVELHDCGIVYPTSGGPYLLCVMTKGRSLDSLQSAIASISKMVYQSASSSSKQ